MRFLYVLCFVALLAGPASAQQASQTIANQIGQLVIQNANLVEQLQAANARIKELEDAKQKPEAGPVHGNDRPQPSGR